VYGDDLKTIMEITCTQLLGEHTHLINYAKTL